MGRDVVLAQHDARGHAAALVALIERLGPRRSCGQSSTLRALEQMAESQLRAELMAEHYRIEAGQWFTLYHGKQEELARERETRQAEQIALDATRADLENERRRWTRIAAQAEERVAAFKRTRRYRLAQVLAAPLERLRWRSRH